MQLHDFYIDALDRVLTWDLPEATFPMAVSAEAGHLAGLDSERIAESELD